MNMKFLYILGKVDANATQDEINLYDCYPQLPS